QPKNISHTHDIYRRMIPSNEIIEILWRREDFIELIQDNTSVTREEIINQSELSKPAVYNKLKQLEEHKIIRETRESGQKSYEFTTFGKVALERYRMLERVCDFSQPLSNPAVEEEIPQKLISKSEFYPSEPYAPHEPIEEVEQFLKENDTIKSLATTVLPTYVEMYYENIMNGTEIELVFQKDVMTHLKENYPEQLDEALGSGNLTVWVTDETIPFGLVASPNGMRLVKYVSGNLIGVISCDGDDAAEWAENLFNEFKEEEEQSEKRMKKPLN
ncbi:MAG: hypothetical protein SXQ77_13010, partial [Halobacteria archaeon]|nr:hypothetical protein [Halobacteria archaeon]